MRHREAPMKSRAWWKDYPAYLVLRIISMLLAIPPIETTLRAMRGLGSIWFHVPRALPPLRIPGWIAAAPGMGWTLKIQRATNKLREKFCEHRNRAEQHIRLAYPEWTTAQVEHAALTSMQHIAMLAVEVLFTPRLVTQWTWPRHITLTDLSDAIRILLAKRGCIMLTGHYGNWELLGYALATLGFDIVAVMRPLDNEYINGFLLDKRERSGLRLLYKKGVTQSAQEVLESKGTLCFIADQNAGAKGVFVDFFGRKASTYKSIALLAIEFRVPIIVGCARRTGEGFKYDIEVCRIIHPEEWDGKEDEMLWITQEYSKAMESFVRKAPEQYLWMHRRWKSRPKDEQASPAPLSDAIIPS
jgi:KDO2-lipid IV(A) lauroyltransferase